jgi:two-component system, chemotaxis family, CheB/CheR fusion protein
VSQGKPKSTVSSKGKSTDSTKTKFPIVCIGASAGGLEALEQFLGNVPADSGLAYVVIQHLDPTQKGMLPELLQRVTAMKVLQVKDRMPIKTDCVYVIPPNTSMSILKGVLHLFEPIEARGLRLPIDFFMRSLADDQLENSIGVVLSGMGSDGTIGLRAIKEKGGLVLVQDPATAKYDSMPRNAIDSVIADIVAPANVLPVMLIDFFKHIPIVKSNLESEISRDKSSLEKIIILLRTYTGNDFSLYKKNTVYRRIERRMTVHKIEKITTYVHFLQENPKEANILFKELMIGVTNFFRDAPVWEKLKESIIPDILNNLPEGTVLRAWVPGCSTGEEAYSLAMVFKESLEKIKSKEGFSLQIFATDLDNEAIETARRAIFPSNIISDVSVSRLARFFNKTEEGYRVNTEIREMVVFANHNIIMHPPFTKIDILSCRNLLIYMDPELQKKIFGLFYYSINTEGYMILGSAETLGTQSALFTTIDSKLKIFKRAITTIAPELFDFPSSFSKVRAGGTEKPVPAKVTQNIQTLTDQFLIQHFSPAGVLVNETGDIVYISGHTGKYLEPAVGKANMNIFAMLREGLREEFPNAFRKTIIKKEKVVIQHQKVGADGNMQTVNIIIQWIDKPEPLNGYVIVLFVDTPDVPGIDRRIIKGKKTLESIRQQELETELQHAREEMQSTLEEMQTSQEELKSTNEELQSTNEELQSTNEELTTSKEEMQSLNEELQTVNAELQSKVEDFSRVNNDMKNLLNSTDIATLFLDKELNIRRYTNQATKIFKLIKGDIGRPFTDLVSQLQYPELADDAMEVLRTLVFIQKQIPARDNKWFSIRIMPYRTFDDRIDGLVITFINLSELKQVELKLHETEQMNRSLLNKFSGAVVKLSNEGNIQEFNPGAEKLFGRHRKDVLDNYFYQMFIPEKVRKKSEKAMNLIIEKMVDDEIKMQVVAAEGKLLMVEWSVNVLLNNLKLPIGILLSQKIS